METTRWKWECEYCLSSSYGWKGRRLTGLMGRPVGWWSPKGSSECSRALQHDAPKMFKKRDPRNQMLVSQFVAQTLKHLDFALKLEVSWWKETQPIIQIQDVSFLFTAFPSISFNYTVFVCFLVVWSDSFLHTKIPHRNSIQENVSGLTSNHEYIGFTLPNRLKDEAVDWLPLQPGD